MVFLKVTVVLINGEHFYIDNVNAASQHTSGDRDQ